MDFVHLHVRSYYSFLRSLWKPAVYVDRAKALGMNAVALTDEGNLYGWFEFYKYAKKSAIKPIIGVELRVAPKWRTNRDRDNEAHTLVLLAQDYGGFQNLLSIVTDAHISGTHGGSARTDYEILEKYRSGLIALSGNYEWDLARMVASGKSDDEILSRARYYRDVYGSNYFLELQEHTDRAVQPKINETLIRLARRENLPLVATSDVYYASPEDAEARDLLSAIGDGRSLDDPDRHSLIDGNYAMRSPQEMHELFAQTPDAVENTLKIRDSIQLDMPYGRTLIPTFDLSTEEDRQFEIFSQGTREWEMSINQEEWLLRKKCFEGLNTRFDFWLSSEDIDALIAKSDTWKSEKKVSEMSVAELTSASKDFRSGRGHEVVKMKLSSEKHTIVERLEYELTVVDLMGFNGYFCIVADFIGYAKGEGIPVGPGRWSAAGALLAYLSGITDIDPLKYGLLFERFLNPSRVSMPDIDVDFSDEERDKVLSYVREKYGSERVAQVCTFGTMAARAAVKDVGKALWVPFAEMNEFAALIPSKPGTKLKDAIEWSVEFQKACQENPRYQKVVDLALQLEWSVRQLGVHACAVIIAPENVTKFTALQPPPKDTSSTVTQLSQYPLEELGLLKMDFLGLRNLAILDRALKIIESVHGKRIDLLKIDYEDRKVFRVFAEGDTTGVFQFESQGMRKYLRDLKPTAFEDIIAMVSLYRPGPLAYIPTYIDRKYGREKVEYPHPSLETILRPTQGIAVYQEQIMQLVQAFAGFSLGEADILRRAIGKKKLDVLMEQRAKFIDAAGSQWHPEKLAIYIFDEIIKPFADYGFNKSHAACYSMIAYQTAYLKAYYPTEFMTALMTSDEEDTERVAMEIGECKMKWIAVLPPDVRQSRKHFTYVDANAIRFGLAAIKGVGSGPIEAILNAREEGPFTGMSDFLKRTGETAANKKTLESLTLSWALDGMGERASILASIPKMCAYVKEYSQKSESSQIGLFEMESHAHALLDFSLESAPAMEFEQRIQGEKVSIGYCVSGHPLDGLEPYIRRRTEGEQLIEQYRDMLESGDDMNDEWWVQNEALLPSWGLVTPAQVGEEGVVDAPALIQNAEPRAKSPSPRPRDPKVRFVGVVEEIRKTQTKSRELMLIVICESAGFRFTATIFPKSYNELAPKFAQGRIVVVEGMGRLRPQMRELSVTVQSVESYSLTQIRADAMSRGLFKSSAGNGFESAPLAQRTLDAKASDTPPARITITTPAGTDRDKLLDFKDFLQKQVTGPTQIFLQIGDREIDTKFCVTDFRAVQEWWASF